MRSISVVALVAALFVAFSAVNAADVTVIVGQGGGLTYTPGKSLRNDSNKDARTDSPFC
jgi:hypothetical protein